MVEILEKSDGPSAPRKIEHVRLLAMLDWNMERLRDAQTGFEHMIDAVEPSVKSAAPSGADELLEVFKAKQSTDANLEDHVAVHATLDRALRFIVRIFGSGGRRLDEFAMTLFQYVVALIAHKNSKAGEAAVGGAQSYIAKAGAPPHF